MSLFTEPNRAAVCCWLVLGFERRGVTAVSHAVTCREHVALEHKDTPHTRTQPHEREIPWRHNLYTDCIKHGQGRNLETHPPLLFWTHRVCLQHKLLSLLPDRKETTITAWLNCSKILTVTVYWHITKLHQRLSKHPTILHIFHIFVATESRDPLACRAAQWKWRALSKFISSTCLWTNCDVTVLNSLPAGGPEGN